LPTTYSFCPIFHIFVYYLNPKITQCGALAGQIQHMAAQNVGFTPRLLRQMALTGTFQA